MEVDKMQNREMMFNLRPTKKYISKHKVGSNISLNIKVNSIKELFKTCKDLDLDFEDFDIYNVLDFRARSIQAAQKINLAVSNIMEGK
jgi:hypothetical protein